MKKLLATASVLALLSAGAAYAGSDPVATSTHDAQAHADSSKPVKHKLAKHAMKKSDKKDAATSK